MKIQYWVTLAAIISLAVAGCSKKADPAQTESDSGSQERPSPVSAQPHTGWMTDFVAAKAKAAAEGKDLLVDFSGSDWCYWCKKLDDEVFSKPGFIEEASKHFVFVLIDFPSNTSGQSKELQAQNKRLSQVYGIQGYPTVILMRADGTPYAETGYQEGGSDAYLAHVKELREKR